MAGILGIDLGTTNSLIAALIDGVPTPLPNALGEFLTPSAVSVDGNQVLVGRAARERLVTHPDLTIASFKRLMGTAREIRLGRHRFQPEDLSALILRALKADAEAALGEPVSDVVISVPAYFNQQQRKATQLAGELAGLKVRRLVNEPTAAALQHGIHDRDQDATFLILDLGGGTFDVSILERFAGIMEVRATGGDSFLGGDDFTEAMARLIQSKLPPEATQAGDPATRAALQHAAESAKRRLGSEAQVEISVKLHQALYTVALAEAEFETACEPLLERMRLPVMRALRDSRIQPAELSEVVLVGGATRMPMIRRLASRLFSRLPARHPEPDQTIVLGAAICGGLIARDAAFEEVVLTDVCPHSLGVDVTESGPGGTMIHGLFLPIIERNTVIPASRVKRLQTVSDFQTTIRTEVFQGESRFCKDNLLLGTLNIAVPPRRRGEVEVDVRLSYDVSGLLEVDVIAIGLDTKVSLVVESMANALSPEELARRREVLAALKVHPRDQAENIALMERANRLHEQLLGEGRGEVATLLSQFQHVIEAQDPVALAHARRQFALALDKLEQGPAW